MKPELATLFAGYERAHGRFEPGPVVEGKKVDGRAITVREPVTPELWADHLAGRAGLGIVPLRDDGATVLWGCIDIDINDIDHAALEQNIHSLGLPLVVARSKSGGAHLYLFLSVPVAAALVQTTLAGWATALGHAGVEIFPKQTAREKETDIGNWLNMPYYFAEKTLRCGVRDGQPLRLDDFVDHAWASRATPEQLVPLALLDSLEKLCAEVEAAIEGTRDDTLNRIAFIVGQWAGAGAVDKEIARARLREAALQMQPPLSDKVIEDKLHRSFGQGEAKPRAPAGDVLSRGDFKAQADRFILSCQPTLKRHRSEFRAYVDGHYRAMSDEGFRAEVRQFLNTAQAWSKSRTPTPEPFRPNNKAVFELVEALKGAAYLDDRVAAPCWLDGRTDPPPAELLAFPNGLLDLRTGELGPPTPQLFTYFAARFDYDPAAPTPVQWLKFLGEIFLDEADQIALLQEIFGYCLTADISHQKSFLGVGPARSGKGTVVEVLTAMLAEGVTVSPSLHSLGDSFGKQQLIGRQVAFVTDARISRRTDLAVLAETILSVSGGDAHTVNRKHLPHWTGPLPVKIWVISNELPKLGDETGVLASRFVTLVTRQSFLDREDKTLFEKKLRPELPGIMLWALAGLKRLRERGRFGETGVSSESRAQLARMMSSVTAFAEERLEFEPNAITPKDSVFAAWREWCVQNGLPPVAKNTFSQNLLDAYRGLIATKKTITDGKRVQAYSGIRLAVQAGEELRP